MSVVRQQGWSWCLRDGDRIWALHLTSNRKEQKPGPSKNSELLLHPSVSAARGGKRVDEQADEEYFKKPEKYLIIFIKRNSVLVMILNSLKLLSECKHVLFYLLLPSC